MKDLLWTEVGKRLEKCVKIEATRHEDGWFAHVTLPDMSYGYILKSYPTLLDALNSAVDDSEMTEAVRKAARDAEKGVQK